MVKKYNTQGKKVQHMSNITYPGKMDSNRKNALMWYYISWHQKIGDWSQKKKLMYAKEISKLFEAIPMHLLDFKQNKDEISEIIKKLNLKKISYSNGKFYITDQQNLSIGRGLSATNLYALFVYLIDSVSKGLEDKTGFGFVKMAKMLINKNPKKEKIIKRYSDHSVRDFTQRAVRKNNRITVYSLIGKKVDYKYSFDIEDYLNYRKDLYNRDFAHLQFIENKFGEHGKKHYDFSLYERVLNSQKRAIDKVLQ